MFSENLKNWESSDAELVLQNFLFNQFLPFMTLKKKVEVMKSDNPVNNLPYNELHNLNFREFTYKAPEYDLALDQKKKRNRFKFIEDS